MYTCNKNIKLKWFTQKYLKENKRRRKKTKQKQKLYKKENVCTYLRRNENEKRKIKRSILHFSAILVILLIQDKWEIKFNF